MRDAALRRALLRALWRSYADEAECTCGPSPEDRCWECEAMAALGLGLWNRDERTLYREMRQLEHDLVVEERGN